MKIIFLIILLTLTGCTPILDHTTIKDLAFRINTSDGVDRIEAILIAQDFVIRRSLYDRLITIEPYRSVKTVMWYKNGQPIIYAVAPKDRTGIKVKHLWDMYFKDKDYTYFNRFLTVPFHVIVDADTGNIEDWGIKKLREDSKDYSYKEIN